MPALNPNVYARTCTLALLRQSFHELRRDGAGAPNGADFKQHGYGASTSVYIAARTRGAAAAGGDSARHLHSGCFVRVRRVLVVAVVVVVVVVVVENDVLAAVISQSVSRAEALQSVVQDAWTRY